MLTPSLETLRIFLHILAASVWVGGQVVMAGIVPSARQAGTEATKAIANGFARVAWPAYFIAIATGMWNLMSLNPGDQSTAWNMTFGVKFLLVIVMGVTAVVHARTSRRPIMAATGAIGGVAALVTLFLGVLISTPT